MRSKNIIDSIKINTIIDFSGEIKRRVFELSKI
jgi:hypothetical protein